MTRILAYPRPDGQMAVRNHLFVLPAVVCANQVAIDVARDIPGVKYVEHQHGCAQIGADLAQTQRVFSHLAAHPNAFATMLVGLGCEGVVTKDLYEQTRLRTTKPLAVILIQEAGGTPGARAEVAAWAAREQARAAQAVRTAADWPALTVGVFTDASGAPAVADAAAGVPADGGAPGHGAAAAAAAVTAVLTALWTAGARIVVPAHLAAALSRFTPDVAHLAYGELAVARACAMEGGSTPLETATGLLASGAHLLIHLTHVPHAFSTPLAPIVRWALDEAAYRMVPDVFDGVWQTSSDAARLLEQVARVASGELTAAEALGMDDFALYRIGPTI